MKQVILAIRPKFAEAILSGKKKCEFRKSAFPKDVDLVIIYCSKNVGKIIGWFRVKRCRTGKPQDLWHLHEVDGGVSKDEFDDYYSNSNFAVCLEIRCAHRLNPPIDPFEDLENFTIPQSFRYLAQDENEFFANIIKDPHEPNLDFYNL
jgi:predicted transcriptional regulator